ncbi:MAG: hypothetical protein OXM02_11445 [Bacteroidota bacterium]|nr:hypothetical protein [Bacteroidota bacterium]MDE2835116.1 hypothetical protein [Bacteroidota bacterium]MDE2956480.1 hypothetical protein [Bacteroidota bacterium]
MISQPVKIAIQAAMAIVIVVLCFVLYQSVTGPWAALERQQEITDMTRARMAQVRTALVLYERETDHYPGSLDTLVTWVKQDSIIAANPDSVFGTANFDADSLLYSPRTGSEFLYAVNDTGQVAVYILKDPDSDDVIGTETPDISQLNAASWE